MKSTKMNKRISGIIVCLFLLASMGNVQAIIKESEVIQSDDEKKITDTIENFIMSYESALDNEDINFNDIDSFFSDINSSKNKELIKTVLKRKIVLSQEYPKTKLKELNKELKFDYESITIEKNSAEVKVNVTKMFNYNISPDVQSGEVNSYFIKLSRINEDWKISFIEGFVDKFVKEDFNGKGINPNNIKDLKKYQKDLRKNVKEFYKELKLEAESDESIVVANRGNYDRTGAYNYAMNHALNHNNDYESFVGQGGDCTNFTSQCLYEGGGIAQHVGGQNYTDTYWFYNKTTHDRSASWTGANEFRRYIGYSISRIDAQISSFNGVTYSDLVQFANSNGDSYHSLIITGIVYNSSGRSDLLVCGHSPMVRNVSISNAFGARNRVYIKILGYTED
ncbi:amidase domain-containing protein [Herbivorax sp. ANBcel31]|uniref:amidase domain-containing protein n=1 Tax=Herbivorax sp. ANBcel31 TaxID=3069754 RepID=UPI0027B5994B|nr:amidase domain-containing protein [Herbivorax sp. ANBcel31]MDQ2085066.1 amidase domain-containing protein [Herbivorax sp. ANBcel31]